MPLEELLKNLKKLRLREADLYLLALRQVLLNQSEIMTQMCKPAEQRAGYLYQHANDTNKLVERIGEFIENRE